MTILDDAAADPAPEEPAAPATPGGLAPAPGSHGEQDWDLDAVTDADGSEEETSRDEDAPPGLDVLGRPLLATGLASIGAALVIGGTFGSWSARLLGVLAAIVGTAWAYLVVRSRSRLLTQLAIIPVLAGFGVLALITTSSGTVDDVAGLVADAISAGRVFRPPVPYDPGWRVVLALLLGLIGFAAGTMACDGRVRLGVGTVVPFTLFGLFSQPDDATFIASVFAFLPILGALAVLFGDDGERASELGQQFELRRAVQGGVAAVAVVAVLAGLNSASFLFPDPIYNPDDQPQKPRAVPLSASDDRVLFTVATDSILTGPWRIGALDVYADDAFQSVPSESRLEALPADGVLSTTRAGRTQEEVTITVADLGDTAVLPTLAGTTRIAVEGTPPSLRFDPRYQTVRVSTGRVPEGLTYTLSLPPYATADELRAADPGDPARFENELAVPDQLPPAVEELLRQAPANPWDRLDFLRQTLLDRVVAAGAGAPVDVTPERIQEILALPTPGDTDADDADPTAEDADAEIDGNEASPFEIVATEALLARWAGVPSRIGFGFDGVNLEDGRSTVRPRNSAQWLEVFFDGYGWVPLIGQPDQAKASIDNDPNARSTPTVTASSDIAVQVYVIFDQEDLRLLYERVRLVVYRVGPWVLAALLAYAVSPFVAKLTRRRRRRMWAAERGPLARVVVEYAEFRDTAIDLSVGDDYDTPLEYLHKTVSDREHEELAWLVARAVYGDLVELDDDDVEFARRTSASLRSRLLRAQPVPSRALALVSRASIEVPWNTEMPNVRVIRIGPHLRRAWTTVTRPLRWAFGRGEALIGRVATVPRRALASALLRREDAAVDAAAAIPHPTTARPGGPS